MLSSTIFAQQSKSIGSAQDLPGRVDLVRDSIVRIHVTCQDVQRAGTGFYVSNSKNDDG